ncbi:hypothetical protein CKAH01_05330 [Colletotrichum kahawae]|uniref:Uncharacterized protein n=1 Tax=Colletotrichum kahawae TaxID=34407 RepID=A0AAD9YGL8_COLKA|nr:hypothetical protein CKAH01_05330 [Colletotrichum kahawae]
MQRRRRAHAILPGPFHAPAAFCSLREMVLLPSPGIVSDMGCCSPPRPLLTLSILFPGRHAISRRES